MSDSQLTTGEINRGVRLGSVVLRDYMRAVEGTDMLPLADLEPVLMGLYGEVGGIMASAKKYLREGAAYSGHRQALEEEFGDTLWYLTALCRRLGVSVSDVLDDAANRGGYNVTVTASNHPDDPASHILSANMPPVDNAALLNLGEAAAALLQVKSSDERTLGLLRTFAGVYIQSLQSCHLNFSEIVRTNIQKTRGRFLEPDISSLPTFDNSFPEDESLPQRFEIKVTQRKSGQGYLQWNGVFIGEPLTDNIDNPDHYRFHDVFHFAYAAILHWSPVIRSLIKQKRKSSPRVDETQDGGRAIAVEEGLTAWIFSRAKKLEFFAEQDRVSFDLLKTIQDFVHGYEVEQCPLRLWERAILDGYAVFRQVRDNNGGLVIGDRVARTLVYGAERKED